MTHMTTHNGLVSGIQANSIKFRATSPLLWMETGAGPGQGPAPLCRSYGRSRAFRRTVRSAIDLGIRYLTIYSFSTENWTRPEAEVSFLMGLMRRFIRSDLAELHRNGVRIRLIGERDRVDTDLLALMDEAVEITRANTALTLVIAFNYGGRGEIAKAARQLAAEIAAGGMTVEGLTPDALGAALDTADLPDPDLLIRTSGEERLSNFLLWQLAYAEFLFLDVLWPDFDKAHLERALQEFRSRNRRLADWRARRHRRALRCRGKKQS